jgi:hypothetical protein
MNDLGKAFSFAFKDPSWFPKFIVGAVFMLLSIVLIGIFVLAGYFIQVTQRVMRQDPNPLPEWSDIGVMLIVGFKFCVVYLIYVLPIVLLYIPFFGLTLLGQFSHEGNMAGMFASIYLLAALVIIIPYGLLLSLLTPIITYRFAERESMSDALDIADVFRSFKRNWQSTLIIALIAVGIQSFAPIGLIVFFVGIFFTIFYAYLVSSYMYGTLYLQQAEGGTTAR